MPNESVLMGEVIVFQFIGPVAEWRVWWMVWEELWMTLLHKVMVTLYVFPWIVGVCNRVPYSVLLLILVPAPTGGKPQQPEVNRSNQR